MKTVFHSIFVISAILFSLNTNAQIISTIAGTVGAGFSGDGGVATSAQLNNPSKIGIDAAGNKYIVDNLNHRIRKVNLAGVISTFAGTGVQGFGGDGGLATSAQLNSPFGVAIDVLGNVYIAEYGNHRIRKVNTSGIISTFAGTGVLGFSGDGGLATAAQLASPFDVTIDASGNIYISDAGNSRIRKVNTSGIISTFAGTGFGGFSGDGGLATSAQIIGNRGIALDASGNFYIADMGNNRIRKINISGIISTFAGTGTGGFSGDGGPANSAQLYAAHAISCDVSGNIYIADYANHRIRKVNQAGVISTFAGTGVIGFNGDGGAPVSAQLYYPVGLTVDQSGNLYIADYLNNRVRKVACVQPTISISSSASIICIGQSATLTASGGATYTWNPLANGSSVIINPTVTSNYTVTGTNSLTGCSNSTIITQNVSALPSVIASSSNSLICAGESSTLTASGASTYTWNPGGAGINITVSPSVNTTYTLTGTDLNGCSNTAVITQSVDLCTGIVKIYNAGIELKIYPNPFNEKITIVSNASQQTVQIFNFLGSIIYDSIIDFNKIEIDLTQQQSGIYFIKIGPVTKKIIKE